MVNADWPTQFQAEALFTNEKPLDTPTPLDMPLPLDTPIFSDLQLSLFPFQGKVDR